MSRFIDKLNQVSRAMPQPVGFRPARLTAPKPKILLVASLAQANIDDLADYVAGADAGLLHISESGSGAKSLQEISRVVSGIPWGGWLKGSGRGEIKQMVKTGCDFVVFPAANTSLAILQGGEVGKILEVESSLGGDLLRTINGLPVDAVLIASEWGKGYFLTWHHLMLFRRFADLLTKPLLASVPSNVTAGELQALWRAGVNGVVVEVGANQPVGRLKELRRIINKLVPPSPRKSEKAEVLLPYIGRETSIETGGEEEE